MTKRKRTAHIPQGAPRKRRPVRRAFDTTTTVDPNERTDLAGNPVYSDDIANGASYDGVARPVESRSHSVATQAQPARPRGRRIEQLRRSGGSRTDFSAAHASSAPLPVYERSFLINELRTIAITSTALLAVIIALTLILR